MLALTSTEAFSARRFLDGNCAKALCEPDGSPCFGSTDVGTLSNPCHWKSTSPRRLSFILDDCKHRQRVCVQTLRHRKGYDNGRSQKSTVPYAPDGLTFLPSWSLNHRPQRGTDRTHALFRQPDSGARCCPA